MTTIAATHRMMAADSRCTIGDVCFPTTKILRTKVGIVGAAGVDDDCAVFLDWAAGKRKRVPRFKREFQGLLIDRKGLFVFAADGSPDLVKDGFYAIGSGAGLAMGCLLLMRYLDLQMDPRLAVLVACERDAHSAPPVDFLTLRA